MYSLTVIVPFFNEEKFLSESIERILAEKIFEKIIRDIKLEFRQNCIQGFNKSWK